MTVFDRAFQVAAETHDSGVLRRYEPFPMAGILPPWDAPAQWRVGTATWDELKAEAKRANGLTVPSHVAVALLGYEVVVDEAADPDLMVLEAIDA